MNLINKSRGSLKLNACSSTVVACVEKIREPGNEANFVNNRTST